MERLAPPAPPVRGLDTRSRPGPPRRALLSARILISVALVLASCRGTTHLESTNVPVHGALSPAPSALRRLSVAQYTSAIHDTFGDDVIVPPRSRLEPDVESSGYLSIDASSVTISRRGVTQYETAAYSIAAQALDATHRANIVPCAPASATDATCAEQALEPLGLRLFRHPIDADDLQAATTLSTTAGAALGDFYQGLEYGIAYLLQSPRFLFREELGAPDPESDGELVYGGYEMASRLSFFLWNSSPDQAMLDAAASGELDTADGVRAQAQRMLADPRAEDGVREIAYEWFGLSGLDDLSKDTTVYTQISPDVGPAAREETLRGIAHLFAADLDARDLMTTRNTFVDRKLASIYLVRAPRTDWDMVTFEEGSPRAGLLGQISFLALYAHPVATSPTLRGKFIRERLLCQPVPPPPVGVNTAIPEPSADAPTLRSRLLAHQTVAYCASCHRRMDNIGLGLEAFDALGSYRDQENGVAIDASGNLDGVPFRDALELSQLIHDDSRFANCIVRQAYRVATGHMETAGEDGTLDAIWLEFSSHGYSLRHLMESVVVSDGFRRAVPQPAAAP